MSIELGLKGKVAIVTGGAGGIGTAVIEGFAKEGANVVIADIDLDAAQKLADKVGNSGGVKALAVKTDVSKKADVDNVVALSVKEFGKIDILVNTAAIDQKINFVDIEEEDWDRLFNINAKGTYLFMRAVLPHMMAVRYGKVINFSSIVGKEGIETFSHYSASKFAVTGLTQAVAKEMAEYDINVNAVCPGIVRTHLWEHLLDTMHEETGEPREQLFAKWVQRIALNRPQTPEDIAAVVLFLSSDISKNITGEAININGGMKMD